MKTFRTLSILFALVAAPSLALADRGGAHDGKHDGDRDGRRAKMVEKFDANNDGKLDDAERATMHETRANKRFDALDTDGNGSISRAEFKAGAHQGKHKRGMRKGKDGKAKDAKAKGATLRNTKAKQARRAQLIRAQRKAG